MSNLNQLSDSIAELTTATDARFARDAAEIQRLREANAELVAFCKMVVWVSNFGGVPPELIFNARRLIERAEPSPITLPPTAENYAASHDDAGDELAVWERPDRFEQE